MTQPVWSTAAGLIGVFPSQIPVNFQLSASPVLPATILVYKIISGSLPAGLSMDIEGLITGTPEISAENNTYPFVVRVTDNLGNIKDRTFSLSITGSKIPSFLTPGGSILITDDSVWVQLQIDYFNPVSDKNNIRVVQGQLPEGLEINETGLIRGYAKPPVVEYNLPSIITSITATVSSNNYVVGLSTIGFKVGRPIVFTGTPFGVLIEDKKYYIHSIIDETTFKITTSPGDDPVLLSDATGYMTAILDSVTIGQPTTRTYSFTLKIQNIYGSDLESYSITVVNQNTYKPGNTRLPVILNTRPLSYNILIPANNYGYYVLPPNSSGQTYLPQNNAYIGQFDSDNYFSFKILGIDFDNTAIEYVYSNLPLGLIGDPVTGWITGNPILPAETIEEYSFQVLVQKVSNTDLKSQTFNFSFRLTNNILGKITWLTPDNLGTIFNGTTSVKKIIATSDVELQYVIVSGNLPPNLTLLSNGEITGKTAYQPTNVLLEKDDKSIFTFTVQAYSISHPVVSATKTFTLTVLQEYTQPTDNLYIKCTPSINDRELLRSLLDNEILIPTEYLYRAEDSNFGKAKSVVYAHAYGIYASDFEEYLAAVEKNHYYRNITLGELSTAVARNDQGEIVYEVVYSNVIDNLVNLKTPPQSISKKIYWPYPIDLNLGPWYTSVTNIYTSYETYKNVPTFYTSLTPGYARILYPNSLPNMRQEVEDVLGQVYDFDLLPTWMTSQQLDGSTLGFIPAWVICYTKPGYSKIIKNNIENNWKNELGQVNKLNQINFNLDRFTVDKSITYDYDKNLFPAAWTSLPSATPTPDPIDSKDFYVLFPRETILPNKTQY